MAKGTNSTEAKSSYIHQAFELSALRNSGRVALIGNGGKGASYTYQRLLKEVRQLAEGLQTTFGGISEIGLLAENRPEWAVTYLSILRAGKTVVPIDANLTPMEIEQLVATAGLKLIFVSEKFASMQPTFGQNTELLCFDSGPGEDWRRLFMSGNLPAHPKPNEVAALIFTSGTTGKAKAVMLTHRNLLSNIEGAGAALEFSADDTFLSLLPLHHTFEATCGFLVPLLAGARIVFARSLNSRDIVDDIARNGISVMCGVPLLYEKMYQGITRKIRSAGLVRRIMFRVLMTVSAVGWRLGQPWGKALFRQFRVRAGMDTIRMFVSGGAALPPTFGRFFNLLGFSLIQGYGMTECSPIITAHRPGDIRFGSVGPPIPNVEIDIANANLEGIGEIIVRGDNVTKGYRDDPEQTAELIRDGWLYTGDLGRIQDGHLWITGRAKNLIVSAAGKNIYPEELEEKLLACGQVLEAVVFGRPKEDRQGEEVRAVVVPDLDWLIPHARDRNEPDMEFVRLQMKEAIATLNANVAAYKRISNYEVRIEELEKTSTRKVKRFLYK